MFWFMSDWPAAVWRATESPPLNPTAVTSPEVVRGVRVTDGPPRRGAAAAGVPTAAAPR